MAARLTPRLREAANVAFQNHFDAENLVTPDRQLTPDSGTSPESQESLWDEDDNLNRDDDDPHTPLTPLSSYESDLTEEESDESEPVPQSSEPESDRPLPTLRLPILGPTTNEPVTPTETELHDIIPGWFFGEITHTVD
jgi:hypothetical protein